MLLEAKLGQQDLSGALSLSRGQHPAWVWQATGGGWGRRAESLARGGGTPAHTICRGQSPWQGGTPPSTHHLLLCRRILASDCRGGGESSLSQPVCKRNSSRSPLWPQTEQEWGRQTVWEPGAARGVSVDRCLTPSLSSAYSFVFV